MVLSGRARYSGMIANRTNVCGGINKSGLPSRIGPVSNRRQFDCTNTCYRVPTRCVVKNYRTYYRPGMKLLG